MGFDYGSFLDFVQNQFEDKQAAQTAGRQLSCSGWATVKPFTDFLQDFEYKLAQCGGALSGLTRPKSYSLTQAFSSTLRAHLIQTAP